MMHSYEILEAPIRCWAFHRTVVLMDEDEVRFAYAPRGRVEVEAVNAGRVSDVSIGRYGVLAKVILDGFAASWSDRYACGYAIRL